MKLELFITRLVIFHNDWSSGTSDSSVTLHWSFQQSFILRVTDFWRRLSSAFNAGSLEAFHCLLNLFFRGTLSVMRAGMGGRGSFLEQVCFRRHYKGHSLLFRSHGTTVRAHAPWQKRAAEKQLVAFEWQHARFLLVECETFSCFQIDLCDSASPLLARFGTGELFSLPEIELALKRVFQRHLRHPVWCDRATERCFVAGF